MGVSLAVAKAAASEANMPLYRYVGGVNANTCLLYTSDAADELLCVNLGGRSIIKKKTTSIL